MPQGRPKPSEASGRFGVRTKQEAETAGKAAAGTILGVSVGGLSLATLVVAREAFHLHVSPEFASAMTTLLILGANILNRASKTRIFKAIENRIVAWIQP